MRVIDDIETGAAGTTVNIRFQPALPGTFSRWHGW